MNRPVNRPLRNGPSHNRRVDLRAKQPEKLEGSFEDVRRKCHLWLMKNDPIYRRNYRGQQFS